MQGDTVKTVSNVDPTKATDLWNDLFCYIFVLVTGNEGYLRSGQGPNRSCGTGKYDMQRRPQFQKLD
jgi:hypothetical protein